MEWDEKYLGGKEMASLAFTLKDYPDVSIYISSEVLFVPEDLLIERHKKSNLEPWMREESVKKREFNGMAGSEMLLYGVKDGNSTHYFKFESQGEVKNPFKPGIILEIQTGGPIDGKMVSTALTTKQVRALYEKVLNSIRPRPVEAPKPAAAAPENVPPRLATGALCPRTGHWRCLEDGKTLSLVEGQRMPYFLLPHPALGWRNWLRGIKNTYTNETGHWEWVGEKKTDGGNG